MIGEFGRYNVDCGWRCFGRIKRKSDRSDPVSACEQDSAGNDYCQQNTAKNPHIVLLNFGFGFSFEFDVAVGEFHGVFNVLAVILLANLLGLFLHEGGERVEVTGDIFARLFLGCD